MQILVKNKDILLFNEFKFKCCIGKNGTSFKKKEGDKKTPKGTYSLGPVYFRKDKIQILDTKLKKIEIKKDMGWCDDVKNKYKYNKKIKVNNHIKHEKLYRLDNKYDLIIPIKYNYKKPKVGFGSCIFIHLTRNYSPTAGCLALTKNNFLIFLKLIDKKTKIKIC